MALEYLRELFGTARQLGMIKDPVDPMDAAIDRQRLENAALQGMKHRRDLAGPSPREEFDTKQREFWMKNLITMAKKVYDDGTDASKTHVTELLNGLPLNRAEQSVLEGYRGASFLSVSEKNMRTFKKGNPRPEWPKGEKGPLEATPANEEAIANFKFKRYRWEQSLKAVGYGVDKAKIMAPIPKFIQILGSTEEGSGEQKTTKRGDLWFAESRSGSVMRIPYASINISDEQLKKRNWTWAMVSKTGLLPTTETSESTLGGVRTQSQGVVDPKTGEQKLYSKDLGAVKQDKIAIALSTAVFAASKGDKKMIEGLTGNTKVLAQILSGYAKRGFDNIRGVEQIEQEANSFLGGSFPGYKLFIPRHLDKDGKLVIDADYSKKSWYTWDAWDDGEYSFDKSPFVIRAITGRTTMTTQSGDVIDVWKAITKDGIPYAVSGDGKSVPGSLGKGPDEPVPDTEVAGAPKRTVGDALQELPKKIQDWMNKDPQAYWSAEKGWDKNFVKKVKPILKGTGDTAELLYNWLLHGGIPGYALRQLLEMEI